jgi:hypothetical protein
MESRKRTIVRTLSYRIIALIITAFWTGFGEAVAIHIVLAFVQYLVERCWLKIK